MQINKLDLIDNYRLLHQTNERVYLFYKYLGKLLKIYCILIMKQILTNLRELKFFRFDHCGIKVGIKFFFKKSIFNEKVTYKPAVWKFSESL